jgi:energy-coupling factor transporter transmembrane protein EcfT
MGKMQMENMQRGQERMMRLQISMQVCLRLIVFVCFFVFLTPPPLPPPLFFCILCFFFWKVARTRELLVWQGAFGGTVTLMALAAGNVLLFSVPGFGVACVFVSSARSVSSSLC